MPKGPRLEDLVDSRLHLLAEPLADRLTSRRFAAFVDGHLTKVRKKLRALADADSARDLLLELDVAYRLVQDKRVTLEYEPTPAGRSRGPDFMAHFTTRFAFMLEVTRLKDKGAAAGAGAQPEGAPDIPDSPAGGARRLGAVLALKLGQLAADLPNVLVIGSDGDLPSATAIGEQVKKVRSDVETTDADALARQGFAHRGEYLRRLERLSAIAMVAAPELRPKLRPKREPTRGSGREPAVWTNPRARLPLPAVAVTLLCERLSR